MSQETRTCANIDCETPVQPASAFPARGQQCRLCIARKERDRREKKKLERVSHDEIQSLCEDNDSQKKICIKCNVEKLISDFRPKRNGCRDCERAADRLYRRSEVGKEKSKKWIEENSDRMKELLHNRYIDNKVEINDVNRERYYTDDHYKHRMNVRNVMRRIYSGETNGKTYNGYLKTTGDIFKKWMEFCCDRLSLDKNKSEGEWHFDHVIPLDIIDKEDEDEYTIAFAWFNVSPYHEKKNMAKKNKVDFDQMVSHFKLLTSFIEQEKITPIELYKKYVTKLKKHIADCVLEN
jgi:hypothetical protein